MADDTSTSEHSSPCRKKAKLDPISSSQTDTSSCPICLDNWSSTGTHRLVSLKCGHLFGQICIEKWLATRGKCPQCNGNAKKSDIRPIYAKIVCAVDNDERDDALRLFEAEKVKRNHLEKLHLKTSMQCQLFASENSVMRKRISDLENKLKATGQRQTYAQLSGHGCYVYARSIFVSVEKKAHVFHSDPFTGMIAISKKFEDSQTQYGVLKISSIDASHHEFVSLHTNQIRDIAFDPFGNTTLLSCSKSKDIKLTCLKSNNTVVTYQASRDCWSCSWSSVKNYIMYCGLQNGEVMVFDIRNTKEVLECISPVRMNQKCPVISVISIPAVTEGGVDGVLVSTLQCITFYKKGSETKYVGDQLDTPPGALSSVSYESNSNHLLASYKPGIKNPKERHVLMKLIDNQRCEPVYTFEGGSNQYLRCRSSLIPCPDDDNHLLVCAGEQATNTVKVWSTKNMELLQSWGFKKEDGPIISVGPHRAAGIDYLCGLTNQRINQYKWLLSKSHFEDSNAAYQF